MGSVDDRIALLLGRAVIRTEVLQAELEKIKVELEELKLQVNQLQKPDADNSGI